MRRRPYAVVLAIAAFLPAQAGARSDGVHEAAKDVRNAIPAAEGYAVDHNGYTGMTLAALRTYHKSLRRIAVRRATKAGYCIESTSAGAVVHYDGPAGPMRTGRCGVRGAVYVPPAPKETPQRLLLEAEAAIEMYHYTHGTYVGMTLAQLRTINYGLRGITVRLATIDRYCVETDVAPTYHLAGPGGVPTPGGCG